MDMAFHAFDVSADGAVGIEVTANTKRFSKTLKR